MIWVFFTVARKLLKLKQQIISNIFSENEDHPPIVDQVKVVSLFNRFITENEAVVYIVQLF
jgi:hypothetical protein